MDTMLLSCCSVIIFILFIISIISIIYVYKNNNEETDNSNILNVEYPAQVDSPYINYLYIMANKNSKIQYIDISKIIIIDKNNNVVIPINTYDLRVGTKYVVSGKSYTSDRANYIITFNPSIIKTISVSGNLKDCFLGLRGNKTKTLSIDYTFKNDYTQVINFKV